MRIANYEKSRWFFYLEWILLNAITAVAAGYVAWALLSLIVERYGDTIQVAGQTRITEDFLLFYLICPIIGLFTGILQYALLRRYLPHMAWWIAATLLGWLLPFIVSFLFNAIIPRGLDPATAWEVLGFALIGITIALPQWWMLRKRVHHAAWWILANGIGWAMVGLLNHLRSEPFIVLSAVALIPAIATGIVCWLLITPLKTENETRSSIHLLLGQ
jgi:hypothetical protein